MDDYEIIEQYADYRIVQKKYNGIPCTFRHDYFDNSVRIKFDDNFARCNGYRNIKDMFTKNPDMKQSILAANGDNSRLDSHNTRYGICNIG